MDLNAYLIDSVIQATTAPGETAASAQTRRFAIQAMFEAHAPADAIQALIASNCVALQFLLLAATKDAFDAEPGSPQHPKHRAAALAIGRALAQCRRQLVQHKKPPSRARAAPAPTPAKHPPANAAPLKTAPVKPAPPKPAPMNPVPMNPAPMNPAPMNPAPMNPAPMNPAPMNPAPMRPATSPPTPPWTHTPEATFSSRAALLAASPAPPAAHASG